jgi:hypothetical protein
MRKSKVQKRSSRWLATGQRLAASFLLTPPIHTYRPVGVGDRQGRSEGFGGAKWIPGSPSSASSPSLPPSCIAPDLTVRTLTAVLFFFCSLVRFSSKSSFLLDCDSSNRFSSSSCDHPDLMRAVYI